MKKINFKSKSLWIGIVIVIVIIIVLIPKGSQGPKYETVKIEKGSVIQTVDATGKLESSNGVSLRFQMSGNIGNMNVKEGDSVTKDQFLASLYLPELDASIAQAQASLNQKLAGATNEQIEVSKKQLESAKIALEKAEKSLIDVTKLADDNLSSVNYSLEKAENSLADVTKLAEENSKSKYNYASSSLDDANIKIYNSYTLIDSIRNSYFTNTDQQGLKFKTIVDTKLHTSMENSKSIILGLKGADSGVIDIALGQMISNLDMVLSSLTEARDICDQYTYKTSIPDTVRNSIDSQKSIVSTVKNSMVSLQNDINVLKIQNGNNINAAKNAVNSVNKEINVVTTQNKNNINNANSAIDTARSNVAIQEANLNSVKAGPREVDIAYSRAVLEQAKASKLKSLLYSPTDGIVGKISKKSGELVGPSDVVIEIISPHQEVEIDVSETDVVKLNIGDEASVDFDALGSDLKFKGKVLTIEPASTDIQGVVYYKVKIGLEDENKSIKSGMTANVLIETERREGVLNLPNKVLVTKDGKKYVKVLQEGKNIIEKEVFLGVKGDGGVIEVVSGLTEGEEVILKTLGK
ncbi:MAG: efflux RND transporter periplasmic adaptor subunit [Candidatus Pacebacteria bacterium]|nr:efflux RND transporter periplasmic adaptor subunit [Candidatus Paceibacterota bacterium]